MSDRNERAAREDAEGLSHGGSIWAPSAIAGGMTGVALLALAVGVAAVVLAALDKRPLIAFVLALIGLITGMRLFLPRLTMLDKLLIPVGVLLSAAALVIQLLHLSQ
jgi:hypothetical protein